MNSMSHNKAYKNNSLSFSYSLNRMLQNLANTARGRKQLVSALVDAFLVLFSLWLAYSLRHGELFGDFRQTWYIFLVLSVTAPIIFASFGIYRWVVRSSNERLMMQLAKGAMISGLILLMLLFLLPADRANPRSLFLVYAVFLCVSVVSIRMIWKKLFDVHAAGDPLAIYGAGAAGRQLASQLEGSEEYQAVMFIDDDPAKVGTTVSGLAVKFCHIDSLKLELKRREISRIVLAIPSLSAQQYSQKIRDLAALEVPVLIMPGAAELMTGKGKAGQLRDVSISDLLGRSEVPPNRERMGSRVQGRTVLVTGGGGSIGSELCRQIMSLDPERLIIFDNCEFNLYQITEELNSVLEGMESSRRPKMTTLLGSVTDKPRVNRVFKRYKVHTVFHAAAYKHVPIIEGQPDQAVRTNVWGTRTVLESAIDHKVNDFVLISTDKAVRPTNAMGASKRVAELILQAKARMGVSTRISMVRFGNVLGSSGSVVPKFKKQIEVGGPITLTDFRITRYFMTIPEAAQLVLQASAIAKGGDVFVLDMGEAVRIEELAVTMVHLYGKKLKRDTGNPDDIEIRQIGLRPGEKMHEELFISEDQQQSIIPKVSTAHESYLEWDDLSARLEDLKVVSDLLDGDLCRQKLLIIANAGSVERGVDIDLELAIENPLMNTAMCIA